MTCIECFRQRTEWQRQFIQHETACRQIILPAVGGGRSICMLHALLRLAAGGVDAGRGATFNRPYAVQRHAGAGGQQGSLATVLSPALCSTITMTTTCSPDLFASATVGQAATYTELRHQIDCY